MLCSKLILNCKSLKGMIELFLGKSAVKRKVETKMVKVRRKKKPETCEECGKTVFRLFEHMKLHKPDGERKRFKCEVCDKTFASYGARHTHNKIKHLGIKQHCDECGKGEDIFGPSTWVFI